MEVYSTASDRGDAATAAAQTAASHAAGTEDPSTGPWGDHNTGPYAGWADRRGYVAAATSCPHAASIYQAPGPRISQVDRGCGVGRRVCAVVAASTAAAAAAATGAAAALDLGLCRQRSSGRYRPHVSSGPRHLGGACT